MTNVQGNFYPLQYEEWRRACQELTPSAKDVLYLIRTRDPFNNGLDVSPAQLARELSTEARTVHRSTISRALKELDAKGFIDLELYQVRVTVKPKGIHCDDETACCDNAPLVRDDQVQCDDATSSIYIKNQDSFIQKTNEKIEPELKPTEPSADIPNSASTNQPPPNQPKDLVQDKNSAQCESKNLPFEQEQFGDKHVHPTQKTEDRFRNTLHPWQNSTKYNDFDEGFIAYLRIQYLPTTDHYKGQQVKLGAAKNWINKRQWDKQGLAEIHAQWDDYQELSNQAQASAPPDFDYMSESQHRSLYERLLSEGKDAFFKGCAWHRAWYSHLMTHHFNLINSFEGELKNAS